MASAEQITCQLLFNRQLTAINGEPAPALHIPSFEGAWRGRLTENHRALLEAVLMAFNGL